LPLKVLQGIFYNALHDQAGSGMAEFFYDLRKTLLLRE
jgi:hypothetical protein